MGVDVVERVAVVLVERAGVEDGVEVDRVDAEVVEVVELVDHALQVAAVAPVEDAVLVEVRRRARSPSRRGRTSRSVHGVTAQALRHAVDGELERGARRVVRRVAVAEALGEELVEDGVGGPCGDVRVRGHRSTRPPKLHRGLRRRDHVRLGTAGEQGERSEEERPGHSVEAGSAGGACDRWRLTGERDFDGRCMVGGGEADEVGPRAETRRRRAWRGACRQAAGRRRARPRGGRARRTRRSARRSAEGRA